MTIAPFSTPAHWNLSPSPNHATRIRPVTAIVLHADASAHISGTLDWLSQKKSAVSYHVIVDRDGTIYQCVSPDHIAWHAGESELAGTKWCNSYALGVCMSNRNDGHEPYPELQLQSAAQVCAELCQHFAIALERIVTHAAVARPLGRKTDPKGLDVAAFVARVDALRVHQGTP